jgi:mRNA interferase RelE/StbE
MAHSTEYLPSAKKELDALPRDTHKRVISAVRKLKENPRPSGCKKLRSMDAYRIRVGDYRVIYEIHDNVLVVLVIKIAHWREAYQ